MNIHEVLEFGPIVFSDPRTDTLITINSAYLNWWAGRFQGSYVNVDVRSRQPYLCTLSMSRAQDLAKAWYDEGRRNARMAHRL